MTKAMILAGGRNSRMGELAPKALLPVSGRPNVQRVIEGLHPFDLSTFYVNSHLGLTLDIARKAKLSASGSVVPVFEPSGPEGTASIVRRVCIDHDIPYGQPLFVAAADTVFPNFPADDFISASVERFLENTHLCGSVAFVIRPYGETIGRYPVAIINENDLIVSLEEPPRNADEAKRMFEKIKCAAVRQAAVDIGFPCLPVNTCFYFLLRELFDVVQGGGASYDFGRRIFKEMPVNKLFAFVICEKIKRDKSGIKKEWIDMATPSDFWHANWLFIKTASDRIKGCYDHARNLKIGARVTIDPGSEIADSIIGDDVEIGPGCKINNSVIGDGSKLSRCSVQQSVLLPGVFVNAGFSRKRQVTILDSVLGGHCDLFLDGNTGISGINGRQLTPLKNGGLFFTPLEIRGNERQLAVDCFAKLRGS